MAHSDSRLCPKHSPGHAGSHPHPLSWLCSGCKPALHPAEYLQGMLQSENRDFLLSKEKQAGQSGTAVTDTLCLCTVIALLVFLGLKLNTNTDLNSFPTCHPSKQPGALGRAARQRLRALSIPQAAIPVPEQPLHSPSLHSAVSHTLPCLSTGYLPHTPSSALHQAQLSVGVYQPLIYF